MTISRRTALAGAAAAVAVSPALANSHKADASFTQGDDSELLARCEHFWACYREVQRTFTDWQARKYGIEADPTCPSMGQDYPAWNQRMEDGGSHALYDVFNDACHSARRAVESVFEFPAHTVDGLTAKIGLVREAVKISAGDSDDPYEYFEPHDIDARWFDGMIADLERIGGAS